MSRAYWLTVRSLEKKPMWATFPDAAPRPLGSIGVGSVDAFLPSAALRQS
jgi:hypothetical protein